MNLNVVFENIGGGLPSSQPLLRKLGHILTGKGNWRYPEYLASYNPDVVLLAEVPFTRGESRLINEIAETCQIPNDDRHVYVEPLSPSHLPGSTELGLGILTKYPIVSSAKAKKLQRFLNPNLQYGNLTSHEKGMITAYVELKPGRIISVSALHMLPFHIFQRKLTEAAFNRVLQSIIGMIQKEIGTGYPVVLGGDFNNKDVPLKDVIPLPYLDLIDAVVGPTVLNQPKQQYDHILVSNNIRYSNSQIHPNLSDHFALRTKLSM